MNVSDSIYLFCNYCTRMIFSIIYFRCIIRLHRSATCIDAAWSICHNREPAKTTEPIEMSFGLWTWVGPKKHV